MKTLLNISLSLLLLASCTNFELNSNLNSGNETTPTGNQADNFYGIHFAKSNTTIKVMTEGLSVPLVVDRINQYNDSPIGSDFGQQIIFESGATPSIDLPFEVTSGVRTLTLGAGSNVFTFVSSPVLEKCGPYDNTEIVLTPPQGATFQDTFPDGSAVVNCHRFLGLRFDYTNTNIIIRGSKSTTLSETRIRQITQFEAEGGTYPFTGNMLFKKSAMGAFTGETINNSFGHILNLTALELETETGLKHRFTPVGNSSPCGSTERTEIVFSLPEKQGLGNPFTSDGSFVVNCNANFLGIWSKSADVELTIAFDEKADANISHVTILQSELFEGQQRLEKNTFVSAATLGMGESTSTTHQFLKEAENANIVNLKLLVSRMDGKTIEVDRTFGSAEILDPCEETERTHFQLRLPTGDNLSTTTFSDGSFDSRCVERDFYGIRFPGSHVDIKLFARGPSTSESMEALLITQQSQAEQEAFPESLSSSKNSFASKGGLQLVQLTNLDHLAVSNEETGIEYQFISSPNPRCSSNYRTEIRLFPPVGYDLSNPFVGTLQRECISDVTTMNYYGYAFDLDALKTRIKLYPLDSSQNVISFSQFTQYEKVPDGALKGEGDVYSLTFAKDGFRNHGANYSIYEQLESIDLIKDGDLIKFTDPSPISCLEGTTKEYVLRESANTMEVFCYFP